METSSSLGRKGLLRKSPYSVRIWENTDQKNSVFGHFSRCETLDKLNHNLLTAKLNAYSFSFNAIKFVQTFRIF